ncbi:MAG: glycosyltransferase [Candidatus Acidoferrales bacterium]
MTGKPEVSVLIPTYNRAHFLPECLASVLSQTLPPSQVIVINDGSTDHTGEVLHSYPGRVEYLEKENGGKASALNLGLSRVSGDYVWIMDDDDVALGDSLERHLRVLENRPEIGFTYGGRYRAETGKDGRISPLAEVLLPQVSEEELFLRLLEQTFILCPAMVVRTCCYRQVGGFDPALIRSQDYEMILRLSREYQGARVKGPMYYQRFHGGLRGTAGERFSANLRSAKRREYTRAIIKKVRGELPLREYLPRGGGRGGAETSDQRRAYLQRMAVMGANGLYEEMQEDLRAAIAEPVEGGPLSAAEGEILLRLAHHMPLSEGPLFQFRLMRRIRSLCRNPIGQTIQGQLARGLYQRARKAWASKAYGEGLKAARAGLQLGGVRGAADLMIHVLSRRLNSRQRSSSARPSRGS